MDFANNNEILYAHNLLLNGKPDYDEEHLAIIKSNESQFFQACPGSGKTTTLLAKLIILANKMPFADGRGICVLTHTNVAIDEIKAKIGQQANILFQYPNFFGTFQTFIHKYIVKQALFYYYGSKIEYVDDDIYYNRLFKKIQNCTWDNKFKGYLYGRAIGKTVILTDDQVTSLGGEQMLLSANVISNIGKRKKILKFQFSDYDWNKIPINLKHSIKLFKEKMINQIEWELIHSIIVDEQNHKLNIQDKLIGLTTPTAQAYCKIKNELYKEGILSYNDAYDLSFRYIRDLNFDIKKQSANRFQYLFIDEVQDCSRQQLELISLVFSEEYTITQRFGDYCQAIFESDEESDNCDNLQCINKLTKSNRFGELIAKPLRTICKENNVSLRSNPSIPSVKPIIIAFTNSQDVLPKYVELLETIRVIEYNNFTIAEISKKSMEKDPLHRINIKACGWRSYAEESKLSLCSYYPSYNHKLSKTTTNLDCMEDYLITRNGYLPKDYANSIWDCIVRLLRESNITYGSKWYSKASLLETLDKKDANLKRRTFENIMQWVSQIIKHEPIAQIKQSVYKYFSDTIVPSLGETINTSTTEFYNRSSVVTESAVSDIIQNVYSKDGLDIEISTVHKVKGETHIATLYLETFYKKKYESEYAGAQIKGEPYNGDDTNTLMALKVMYVGMSRPQYFLCFAIEKSRFDAIDCEELRNIWDVVSI